MTWWCASVQMSWFTRRRSTNTSATTSTRPSASSLVRLFALFSSGAGTLLNSKQPSIVVVPLNNLLYSHQILYFYEKTSAKYTFINILCGYLNINIIIIWFEFLSILILVLLFCLPPWKSSLLLTQESIKNGQTKIPILFPYAVL